MSLLLGSGSTGSPITRSFDFDVSELQVSAREDREKGSASFRVRQHSAARESLIKTLFRLVDRSPKQKAHIRLCFTPYTVFNGHTSIPILQVSKEEQFCISGVQPVQPWNKVSGCGDPFTSARSLLLESRCEGIHQLGVYHRSFNYRMNMHRGRPWLWRRPTPISHGKRRSSSELYIRISSNMVLDSFYNNDHLQYSIP